MASYVLDPKNPPTLSPEAKARLDAANEARAAADKAVQSLAKERAKCASDAEDAELAAKRGARDLEASRAESAAEASTASSGSSRMRGWKQRGWHQHRRSV